MSKYLHILTVVFIVLQVLGQIDWTWWQIVMPSLISFGITGIAILIAFITGLITVWKISK